MGKRQQMFFEDTTSKMSRTQPAIRTKKMAGKFGKSQKVLAAFIKKVIDQKAEHKEVQIYNPFATAPLTATQSNLFPINLVAEGTDYNTRVGRSITHQYVEIDLGITATQSGAVGANTKPYGDYGFWAVVLDREPQGSNAVFTDIFDQVTAASTPAAGASFRTTASNQDRFKILCREEWAVGANAPAGTSATFGGSVPYHIKKYIDLTNLKGRDKTANFNGSGGNIAQFDNGTIYFVIASTLSDAFNNVNWTSNTKYRFTDV